MKYIGLDLVRVTEGAAVAASYWIGSGDKELADKAASEAMKDRLLKCGFSFRVAVGEGKKDKSFGLFPGEMYGSPESIIHDLAIDPIEGTTPTVTSGPEAISVVGVTAEHCMFSTEEFYMNKLAYGYQIASKIKLNLNDPIEHTVALVSAATGKKPNEIMVCILNRPRHDEIIRSLRSLGVRIKLIQDCDVSGAIAACLPDRGIDFLYGIGGSPECVLAACAIKCLKGELQAQITDKDGKPLEKVVHSLDDLVKGNCEFAATGITNGSLLEGVRFTDHGPVTHSVFMRSESGTIRWMRTYHGN